MYLLTDTTLPVQFEIRKVFPEPNPRFPGTLKIPVAAHFGQVRLFLTEP
jgi:hypothetical protein